MNFRRWKSTFSPSDMLLTCNTPARNAINLISPRTPYAFSAIPNELFALPPEDGTSYLAVGLIPRNSYLPPEEQVANLYSQIEAWLRAEGLTYAHVVRTWFYLDKITAWYPLFNAARDTYCLPRLAPGFIPASTGIGCANVSQSALTAAVWAVKPAAGTQIVQRPSPLQNPATDYRSTFARAVRISGSSSDLLALSGTASIGANGKSLHQGDTSAQINHTLDVVEAILLDNGRHWQDLRYAVAYLKNPSDLPIWERIRRARGLAQIPLHTMVADICREELTFEMEALA